ncbi:hypothetical protein SCOR_03080 [Sulfidibacter corallicola]|uniref:Uncharacterized protein n=1 Tax=Sulfidibacter corallicola TaxID=2818388 RepID=A0A8A4TI80_SULCO|nr:hypothetical protein [Sulfidibacter corallicola]QTD48488.1 hypothetical protein J3U87_23155 [Sulfidibacter corallicola]
MTTPKDRYLTNSSEPRTWNGPSLTTWSTIIYYLSMAMPIAGRLAERQTLPLFTREEYMAGAYPMMWLVYACMPLLFRDVAIRLRRRQPFDKSLKRNLFATLVSLPLYPLVFGWM